MFLLARVLGVSLVNGNCSENVRGLWEAAGTPDDDVCW